MYSSPPPSLYLVDSLKTQKQLHERKLFLCLSSLILKFVSADFHSSIVDSSSPQLNWIS